MIQAGSFVIAASLLSLLASGCSQSDSDPGKIETRTVNGMEITAGQGKIPDHVLRPPASGGDAAKAKPAEAHTQGDGHVHKSEPPPARLFKATPPVPVGNASAPKISFKEMEWDFGTVIEGEECRHIFEFKNEGPGDLILTNVQASCGCTAKKVTIFDGDGEKDYVLGTPIPSGTSGKIEAILNTANIHGTKSSRITVVSNDPQSPNVGLTVQAVVEQFFQLEPPNVYQGQIFSKSGSESTIKVTCLKADEFEVTGFEKIPDGLEFEFVHPDPARKNYGEIKIRFKPGIPEGVFNQQIVALTKVPGQEKPRNIRFLVTGTVMGPIQITPPHAGFGLIGKGKSQTTKITIQNRDPKFSLELSDVQIDSPQKEFLTATLKKEMEGQTFFIELTVDGNCPPGVFKGTLAFKTNHPEKPEHRVSFSGVVR